MATQVTMPALGEGLSEGTVNRWLKQPGDPVSKYEPLLEVSTDKVDTEIPSPADGILLSIQVNEGATVSTGTVLAMVGEAAEVDEGRRTKDEGQIPGTRGQTTDKQVQIASEEPAMGRSESAAFAVRTEKQAISSASRGQRISPVVARIAAENQVNVEEVPGTGVDGRVTKQDILKFIEMRKEQAAKAPAAPSTIPVEPESQLPPWEQPGDGDLFHPTAPMHVQKPGQRSVDEGRRTKDESLIPSTPETKQPAVALAANSAPSIQPSGLTAASDDETVIELTPMRRAIAEHMVRSKSTSPHVTTVMEVDMSAVLAHFQKQKEVLAFEGIRLTYTPYFMMATIAGLKAVPQVNSTWRDNKIVLKRRIHLGMAAALPEGLIVPVIKNADEKNLRGLARAVNDLAERARAKRLQPDEVQGGTFTITNHGVSGSLMATPIINQPQAGILGVGVITKRAVVINDAIAIHPMCYLSFTFDHRILDGAEADHFLATVKATLENWAGD